MKITDALLGEHGVFYRMFDMVERLAQSAASAADVRPAVSLLTDALISHARLENDVLFAAIRDAGHDIPPLMVMEAEHAEIEDQFHRLLRLDSVEHLRQELQAAILLTCEHFAKEEEVLFPIAEQLLGDQLAALGQIWADQRDVFVT